MKALCQFDESSKCIQCGYSTTNMQILRTCTARKRAGAVATKTSSDTELSPWEPQLGDRTEQLLTKMGITKERYQDVRVLFGLAPQCNCSGRIEQLNEWSTKVAKWWQGVMS